MYIFPYLHSTYKNNRLSRKSRSKGLKNCVLYLPLIYSKSYPTSLIPIHTFSLRSIARQYSIRSQFFSVLPSSFSFVVPRLGTIKRKIYARFKQTLNSYRRYRQDWSRIRLELTRILRGTRIELVTWRDSGYRAKGVWKRRGEGRKKRSRRTGIKSHRFRSIQEDTLLARPDSLLCKKNGELEAVDLELIFQEEGTRGISRMAAAGI